MESVRLLNRKAKKKQHFMNPVRMTETLPWISAYKRHTTNLQDDWPINNDPWNKNKDTLQHINAHVKNTKEIHYPSSSSSKITHQNMSKLKKLKNYSCYERLPNSLFQEEISSESSKCGVKKLGDKISSQHVKPLVERPINVLENASVLNMVDSITQSFTKALTDQSKVHSEACTGLYGLIQDVVGVNRELGSVVVDGVQKQTMLMNKFLHSNIPKSKKFCHTKEDDMSFFKKEDTINAIFHTKNILINNSQHFHSNRKNSRTNQNDEKNNEKPNEFILSQQLPSCERHLLHNEIVIVELPLESQTLNVNEILNSKVDFSCQCDNDIDSKSTLFEQLTKSFENQKTKASQTETILFTKENKLNDNIKIKCQELNSFKESIKINSRYIEPIENLQVQAIDFLLQNNDGLYRNSELYDTIKYESQKSNLLEESYKNDLNNELVENFEEEQMSDGGVDINRIGHNPYEHNIMKVDISTSVYNITCHLDDSYITNVPSNIKKESELTETSSSNLKDDMDHCLNSKILELDETSISKWHESMMYPNVYNKTSNKDMSNETNNNCSSKNIMGNKEGCCNDYDFDEFENDVESISSIKNIDEFTSKTNTSNDSPTLETNVSQQHSHINEESLCSKPINDVLVQNLYNEETISNKLNQLLSKNDANESKNIFEDVSIGSSSIDEVEISKIKSNMSCTYQTNTNINISSNYKTYEDSKNKKIDLNTQLVKKINNSAKDLEVANSKLTTSGIAFTKKNLRTQKEKNVPIWRRYFSAVLKIFKRRLNATAIKIQSHYSRFRCRCLMSLQKHWKYHLRAQSLNRIKFKSHQKTSELFLPLFAPCIANENGLSKSSYFRPNINNSTNSNAESSHSKDMNNIEIISKSDYFSSSDTMNKSLNNDREIYEGSLESQIHKCYEKISSEQHIHSYESRQSLEGPYVYVCYEKQSSQHQVHVCFNKQPLEDNIKGINDNLKAKEKTKIKNITIEKIWNSIEEKDFMAFLACNLKKFQNYFIHKSFVKDQKVAKRDHFSTKFFKLNVFKPSKSLSANAFKNCMACGPPLIDSHEDCIVCYRPPIHNCSKSCLLMKKEALPSKVVMATMKEMTLKLCKLKHSAISLDLEIKKIERMHNEMAPTPAYDILRSKPYTWPLMCTKLQNEQIDLVYCKTRPCGHAHVYHQSTHHILQHRHQQLHLQRVS